MGWLLLWCAIGALFVAMLAGSGWRLWRKGRALYDECRTQGRTVGELLRVLGELELSADGGGDAASRRRDS